LAKLKQNVSADVNREARHLAEFPGVLQQRSAEEVYELAALTILRFENEVEASAPSFHGQSPLENDSLMWRIQLVADHILSQSLSDFDG